MLNNLSRVRQQTGSYCGPAAFEMLVSALGLSLDQEAIVEVCGGKKMVMKWGVPLVDLAKGLKKIYPDLTVWVKRESAVAEIKTLIDKGYAVAVDWQGIFDRDEYLDYKNSKWEELWDKVKGKPVLKGDQGHYCVMLEADLEEGYLRFADPYGHYAGKDRFIAIWEFEERWWDDRIGQDEQGKEVRIVENKLMFLVTPKEDDFPATMGMERV